MDVLIFGKAYQMAYTVSVQEKIGKRFGGITNIADAFDGKDAEGVMDNMAFMAACLIEGAVQREQVRCKVMGCPAPELSTLTVEELKLALNPVELKDMTQKIMETISEGSKVTVEAMPDPKKRKAAQSK